jgi:hypothetical protein
MSKKNNNRRSVPEHVEKTGQERFFSKDQKRRKILCMPEDVKEVTIGGGKSRDPELDPPVDHSGPWPDRLIAV